MDSLKLELKNYLNDAIDVSNTKPVYSKFVKVRNMINNQPELSQYLVEMMQNILVQKNNFHVIQLILELIDYTNCQCDFTLHIQFNNKKFLSSLNSLLVDQNVSVKIKEKILRLVQTWRMMFYNDKKDYKNFVWYYQQLRERGIPFPQYQNSRYIKKEEKKIEVSDMTQDLNWELMGIKERKLLKDLEIVRDNVILCNQVITQGSMMISKELMERIDKMQTRILSLPDVLEDSGEQFLYKYSIALLYDIERTKERYDKFQSKEQLPPFESKVSKVVQQENEKNYIIIPQIKRVQKSDNEYQTKIQEQEKQLQSQQISDPFQQLNNVYYSEDKTEQTQNKEISETQKNMFLDMNTVTESIDPMEIIQQQQSQIKFGPKNDSYEIDLMSRYPIEEGITLQPQVKFDPNFAIYQQKQEQPQKKHHNPQNKITYEKIEKQELIKEKKIEYDPFGDIDDLSL